MTKLSLKTAYNKSEKGKMNGFKVEGGICPVLKFKEKIRTFAKVEGGN
jgi:hypothetical protein